MKTAAELGISQAEHDALNVVAAGLASGEYVYKSYTGPKVFDMNTPCASVGCGTVACIGGWVGLQMGLCGHEAHSYVMDAVDPIAELYYPSKTKWGAITPSIAAKAIYKFLDGEKVDYAALLGDAA